MYLEGDGYYEPKCWNLDDDYDEIVEQLAIIFLEWNYNENDYPKTEWVELIDYVSEELFEVEVDVDDYLSDVLIRKEDKDENQDD